MYLLVETVWVLLMDLILLVFLSGLLSIFMKQIPFFDCQAYANWFTWLITVFPFMVESDYFEKYLLLMEPERRYPLILC